MKRINHLLEVDVQICITLVTAVLCSIRLCRCCCSVTARLCWHSQQVSTSASLLATEQHLTTNNKGPHLQQDVCSLSGPSCVMSEVALGTEGCCKEAHSGLNNERFRGLTHRTSEAFSLCLLLHCSVKVSVVRYHYLLAKVFHVGASGN